MSKKIVAIGGGENGRPGPNGMRYPYELANDRLYDDNLYCRYTEYLY